MQAQKIKLPILFAVYNSSDCLVGYNPLKFKA